MTEQFAKEAECELGVKGRVSHVLGQGAGLVTRAHCEDQEEVRGLCRAGFSPFPTSQIAVATGQYLLFWGKKYITKNSGKKVKEGENKWFLSWQAILQKCDSRAKPATLVVTL